MTRTRRVRTRTGIQKMPKRKRYIITLISIIFMVGVVCFFLQACAPTYPREGLEEAVKTVCRAEYDMDVEVTVVGNTIGIYHPMTGLLDASMGISKVAWDKISSLILIASRVVLSTDADIKFYCVITQDERLPELQVVIIKYVDDVKKGMYRNISRNESFKRTLFSINLTPQAKKERSIEKIFSKIGVGDETREKVLDEFFRSPPTKLSDIGYWRGQFYLKNITMPEFLAAQMANRMKIDFRAEKDLASAFSYKSAEGIYNTTPEYKYFLLNYKIADITAEESPETLRDRKVTEILKIINTVVYGYKFTDFNFVIMNDQLENVKLTVMEEDIYNYDPKKYTAQEIVQAPQGYFSQGNIPQ